VSTFKAVDDAESMGRSRGMAFQRAIVLLDIAGKVTFGCDTLNFLYSDRMSKGQRSRELKDRLIPLVYSVVQHVGAEQSY